MTVDPIIQVHAVSLLRQRMALTAYAVILLFLAGFALAGVFTLGGVAATNCLAAAFLLFATAAITYNGARGVQTRIVPSKCVTYNEWLKNQPATGQAWVQDISTGE